MVDSILNKVADRDGKCKVEISVNAMEAYMFIEPPNGEGNWPSRKDAVAALQTEKVILGIFDHEIDAVIDGKLTRRNLVARGKAPLAGKDAEVNFLFETGVFRKAFVEDESGRIDYHKIQTVQDVKPGQVIAEKILATAGESGCDVYGKEVPAIAGKDKPIKLGKNVAWSEDFLRILAISGGEPNLVNNRVTVLPIHELKGNVNFESGNINFTGNLLIRGNVESGFKVEAEGDITIYGNVEAADIRCNGNLFIQGGVSGMDKSNIYCSGDFSAKYIEHASVTCEGNLTVREAIMHCQVNADLKIVVEGGKGLIVGGLIRSGEEISAKTIGSRLGTVTELDVGVRPKMKLELQDIENQIKENSESLDKAEKAISLLSKIPNLPDDRKEMLQNLVRTSYALKAQIVDADAIRQGIFEEMQNRSKEKGRIKIREMAYPGVRVTIGKTTIMVQDEIKFAILYYNEGEIQVQPYR